MPLRTFRLAAAVLAVGSGVAACGGGPEFPPAAEPPDAPPLERRPVGKVVALGKHEPEGLVADPRTGLVAVGLRNPDRLTLVNGASGRKVREVALSESPRHLSVTPDGRVLVPAERSNELIEVSLPDGGARAVEVGEFPHDAIAAGDRVLAGNEFGDTITVIENGEVAETIDTPVQPGGLAAARDGTVVAVAVAERVVRAYDAAALAETGTVDGGDGPTHVVSGCDRRAYVADTEGEAVLVYATAPELRMVARVGVGGVPYGIAIDCRRRLVWVTLPGHNRLVALRVPAAGAPREIASFPTVRQPNSVATDPRSGRVFVAGRAKGELQILQPRLGER